MKKLICIMLVCFSSCKNEEEKIQISEGRYTFKNSVIDGKLSGLVKIWDKNDRLQSIGNYKEGKLDGLSLKYYSNGNLSDSSFYENDKLHGFNYIFKELGGLYYCDFYYHGLSVGPKFYFNNMGTLDFYQFTDFNRSVIFHLEFDSIGVKSKSGEVINFGISSISKNQNRGIGLLLYLIKPPKIKIEYSIGTYNVRTQKYVSNKLIALNNAIFLDTILGVNNTSVRHFLEASYFDSTNNFSKKYFSWVDL